MLRTPEPPPFHADEQALARKPARRAPTARPFHVRHPTAAADLVGARGEGEAAVGLKLAVGSEMTRMHKRGSIRDSGRTA